MNSNGHYSWIVIYPPAFLENCSLHSDWYYGMKSVLFGICGCGYCSWNSAMNSNWSQNLILERLITGVVTIIGIPGRIVTMLMEFSELVTEAIIWDCFIFWVPLYETSGINMRGTLKVDCFRIRPVGEYCNSASVSYEIIISP